MAAGYGKPTIFDTDMGDQMDDCWALALIAKSKELDLVLVTIAGEHNHYRRACILRKLLAAAAKGDTRPRRIPLTEVPIALGSPESDVEGTLALEPWLKESEKTITGILEADAPTAMVNTIMGWKEATAITLISLGPPANVGKALAMQPAIAPKCNFSSMMGSMSKDFRGWSGQIVEYNVALDVAASKRCLEAPWKTATITPLDSSGNTRIGGSLYKKFLETAKNGNPMCKALLDAFTIWYPNRWIPGFFKVLFGLHIFHPNRCSGVVSDHVAVFLALAPQNPIVEKLLHFEDVALTADNQGILKVDPKGKNTVHVAMSWVPGGERKFHTMFMQRLGVDTTGANDGCLNSCFFRISGTS